MKSLFIILFAIFLVASFPAASSEIYLDCHITQGTSGTKMMEATISKEKVCVGDKSNDMSCAVVGEPNQGSAPFRAMVFVSDSKYNFIELHFEKLFKTVALNRYTGEAGVQNFDENEKAEPMIFFSVKRTRRKSYSRI